MIATDRSSPLYSAFRMSLRNRIEDERLKPSQVLDVLALYIQQFPEIGTTGEIEALRWMVAEGDEWRAWRPHGWRASIHRAHYGRDFV